jgi:replicative DNA helicase
MKKSSGGPQPYREEGRVPPYNGEAEKAILGSVLLNNKSLDVVGIFLSPEDFYIESHRRIFKAMEELAEERIPIDHVTLGHKLIEKGDLEKIGGAMALDDLTQGLVTTANVEHHAGIVQEMSATRKVIYSAQALVAEGFNAHGTSIISKRVESVVEASHRLARTKMPDSLLSMGDGVMKSYQKIASGYQGVPLPWPSLHRMTAGMWPGTVTLFVARPNVGKTFLAVIAARYAWLKGNKVLIVSPEMSKEEIAERFFVIHANVSYRDVVAGQLSDLAMPQLEEVIERAKSMTDLWIMDSSDDISPKGVNAAIKACQPHLVGVDSIYGLNIKGDRRERLLGALDWMNESSKQLSYAALAFAQLNRVAELSARKGGGSRLGTIALADELAQDTHTIHSLEQTKDDRADKIAYVRPLKLRRGQRWGIDKVKLNWDFDAMKHDEIPEEEEEFKDEDADEVPF